MSPMLNRIMWLAGIVLMQETANGAECRVAIDRPLPVLELYTSEGCSSCPPADRWLSGLRSESIGDALVTLALHVDYWDSLGWPDRFAHPSHARRQHARVAAQGDHVVYTPQLMLGPNVRMARPGSGELRARTERLRQDAPAIRLELQASRVSDAIDFELAANPLRQWDSDARHEIRLVFYSDGLQTRVRAGENRNRLLRHDRVVRHWLGPWQFDPERGTRVSARVDVPAEAGEASGLIALLSLAEPGAPLWGLDLPLQDCDAMN
jgi:hypothetical protein